MPIKKPALMNWALCGHYGGSGKTGWMLCRFSLAHGYAAKSLAAVSYRRRPAAKQIVAEQLTPPPPGTTRPSRYVEPQRNKRSVGHEAIGRC